jgi:hypothetical protein
MSKRLWRIGVKLSASMRNALLSQYAPLFPEVHCQTITWAYKVEADYAFPKGPLECVVVGRHEGVGHEALIVTLAGKTHKPDGNRLHIVLSTAPGVERTLARVIVDRYIETFLPDERRNFVCRLELLPLWKLQPTLQG